MHIYYIYKSRWQVYRQSGCSAQCLRHLLFMSLSTEYCTIKKWFRPISMLGGWITTYLEVPYNTNSKLWLSGNQTGQWKIMENPPFLDDVPFKTPWILIIIPFMDDYSIKTSICTWSSYFGCSIGMFEYLQERNFPARHGKAVQTSIHQWWVLARNLRYHGISWG